MKPDSPYRKRNAITPTSGGSTTGSAMSDPSVLRPGKSYHSNKNASGMPIAAASATLASEIQMLAHNAAHSPGRERKARQAVARSEEHTSELQSRFDLVC